MPDPIFSRHLQQGIRQYRDAYDAQARAHFEHLCAPVGREPKLHGRAASAGPVSRLATEQAAIHVVHITEYGAASSPSTPLDGHPLCAGVRLAPTSRRRQ
jgi:hypothetical protein